MKSTTFSVEDVFGDIISKDCHSTEQITKLKKSVSENIVNINTKINFDLFKSREKKNIEFEPSALLPENNFNI